MTPRLHAVHLIDPMSGTERLPESPADTERWGPRPWVVRDSFTVRVTLGPDGRHQLQLWLDAAERAVRRPGHPVAKLFSSPEQITTRFQDAMVAMARSRLTLADAARLRVSLAGLHVALPLCADPISLHPSTAALEVLTDLIDDFDLALQCADQPP